MKNEKINNLPILKLFDENQISSSLNKFRSGEFTLFRIVQIVAVGAIGYGLWIYVIPTLMKALAATLAAVTSAVIVLGFIIAFPVILKALRRFTRFLHGLIIIHDPWGELEEQRQKFLSMKDTFIRSKSKIESLEKEMQKSASESEEKAKELENKILSTSEKAGRIKAEIDGLVGKHGSKEAAGNDDEYIYRFGEYQKILHSAVLQEKEMKQYKDFIVKYGTRANIMKKLRQKLYFVQIDMDIKLQSFDSTVEILKRDHEFARKSKEATTSAKNAMYFEKSWELEKALEVVTTTIAEDIAITTANLADIERATTTYNLDNDELYSNLSRIAENIKSGDNKIPEAKVYNNPHYIPTAQDRNSSGFPDIF